MLDRFIAGYYTFFDQKLKSTTLVVLLVVALICSIGILGTTQSTHALQGNLLGVEKPQTRLDAGKVEINGKHYQISLIEVSY